MNVTELDSFKLSDAVKFHNRLNPKIWGRDEHLLPEVREKLTAIADNFREFLGVEDLSVKDITISGSNAAYNYTPYSDIDLHLVVEFPADNEIYQELFNAKKYQYNDEHTLSIGGVPVELYVQNAAESPVSQGEYSIPREEWIQVPRRKRAKIDDTCVRAKVEDLDARIHSAIKSGNADAMGRLWDKIKAMRQSGLAQEGEFGCENIVFKVLRNKGCIKQLRAARTAAQDHELSLKEQNRPHTKKVWGFAEGHQGQPYSSPDGVAPSTEMFLNEDDTEDMVKQFIQHTAERLGIERMPEIQLHDDDAWSEENHSFGMYQPELHVLHVNLRNRHIMDILRTVAHELAHCRQHEIEKLDDHAGATGSPVENEANAVAGIIMRDFADAHPELFDYETIAEASGYIPTRAQAKDPRFKMALTVDVHPGQTGKEANKLALNTGRNGEPQLLMKSANLRESRMPQPSQGPGKYQDLNEPLGPESPPKMPAGTIKVDVSDTQDWYQLGQDISNLKLANKDHYNQGPPHTVLAFGSEELEHMYSKQLKRLGLPTHDLDEPGEEDEDLDEELSVKHLHKELAEEFELLEQEFLGEIKMTGKNLSQLAKNIKDVRVGLEFEMIVPNVSNDDEDGELEPDYDRDESVADIDDAVNFFDDGDYNSGREIRSLRENMQEDFYTWQSEQIDNEWHNSDAGREFFREYMEREDPYDRDDGLSNAEDYVRENNPELELGTDEYQQAVSERLNEQEEEYYTEQWESQGRQYDYAQEEFEEQQRDEGNYADSDWLESEGIGAMSDVSNRYDITWPHYTSSSNDGDNDVKNVALDFMNSMGMDTIAVSNSYHGSYEKWNGSDWVRIGNNKPDDAFTIEPDGSLDGDNSDDAGLEFVSPPIPLEDIGTVMSKVQAWAGQYGAYTGKNNKTSMHTNISVPGYDLDKLDYVKAALLLGDEYVLREFERFGNTYAKPAIEKVRALVKQKPEKAQELLDRMKSQLNAEASKLIHSGQTDKFTSINTKNNRIEYRSPGGDYLSDIADNPKKLIDTINRMVVTMDAAMDPEKYKQEYQKKLYKLLTGQESGREGSTGEKKEMKKDDKDLLNIFSRYAAGELPRAALKSFVRQAQLERSVAKGKAEQGNWGIWINANDRFANQPGSYSRGETPPLIRFPNRASADRWIEQQRAERPNMRSDIEVREIEPSTVTTQEPGSNGRPAYTMTRPAEPIAGSTLDLQRQRAAQQGVDTSVDYELYNRATGAVIDTFPARNDDEARVRLDDYRNLGAGQYNPEAVGVRRGPGVTNTASTADATQGGIVDVTGNDWDADFERSMQQSAQAAQAAQTLTRPGQGQQTFTGEWKVLVNGEEVYRFGGVGNNQGDANRVAAHWLRNNGMGVSGEGFEVYPVMSEGLTEGNQLRLRDFTITISPHALEQCYNRDIDATQVDNILKNISQAKSSIMGQPDNAPLIIHDGQGTALGIRRLAGQQLKLATVYNVPKNFVKGRYPTFQVDTDQSLTESADDYELHDRPKLDRVLAKCCRMVVKGQQRDSERFGQVAACVIDPDNRMIYGINLPGPDGSRRHAERVAIDKYRKSIGEIPEGSIVVTTCSPCNSPMAERYGESCKDLINSVGIHKVYAGYEDPTQHDDRDADFRVYVTENDQLWSECQQFAQSFLGKEELPEAFDQPYKTKSEKSEYGDVDMLAKLPDGSNLSIMFSREDAKNDTWGVEFYRNNSQEVTGEGDAQRVFATVLTAIQKFIKKHKPQKLFFSASKEVEPDQNSESRAKLYDRLVQRYAKAWGYRAFRADTGALVRYELSRLQPVAENFADGRNPQDKGDSKRHGIPKKASLTQLDKIGHGSGRKAQLARWQANMRRGRAK